MAGLQPVAFGNCPAIHHQPYDTIFIELRKQSFTLFTHLKIIRKHLVYTSITNNTKNTKHPDYLFKDFDYVMNIIYVHDIIKILI